MNVTPVQLEWTKAVKKRLEHEKQCKKCPWKVSTNPHKIPNGYSVKKHCELKKTIAKPGEITSEQVIHIMACHETKASHCIGWLMNQLCQGNNIMLRIKMLDYDLSRVRTVGKQHETFEDTLP